MRFDKLLVEGREVDLDYCRKSMGRDHPEGLDEQRRDARKTS